MAKYISNPEEIEAFQFLSNETMAPKWFVKSYREGKASVTINPKDSHITIYGENQTEKAMLSDWICRGIGGKIFVIDNENFKKHWSKL
jgi:hypothetical protein